MATFARVNHDFAKVCHGRSLARRKAFSNWQLAIGWPRPLLSPSRGKRKDQTPHDRGQMPTANCQVMLPSWCLSITIPRMDQGHGKPLAGKAALITGGARRLGRAIALALAE